VSAEGGRRRGRRESGEGKKNKRGRRRKTRAKGTPPDSPRQA